MESNTSILVSWNNGKAAAKVNKIIFDNSKVEIRSEFKNTVIKLSDIDVEVN